MPDSVGPTFGSVADVSPIEEVDGAAGPELRPVLARGPTVGGRPRLGLPDWLRFSFAVVFGGAIFLGWAAIGPLLAARFQGTERTAFARRRVQRSFDWMMRTLGRLGLVTADLRALDAIAAEGPLIVVPNHPSMLDAVIVISRLPAVCCVMKRSLLRNPLTGTGARLAGYVDNGSVSGMVRKSVAALDSGCQLLIFPEGTRSQRRPISQLTRSFALISQRSGIPMQTVLIESDSPYARKGWPLLRPPPRPVRYTVRLGRRFDPSDDIDGQVAAMQAYFEGELDKAAPREER